MRRYLYGLILAFAVVPAACTSSQTSTTTTATPVVKCQVQVASATTAFPADGGQGTIVVDTNRDCTWSIVKDASWVSVASTSGQGEASIGYTVAANPVPVARAAAITANDSTVQLNQEAAQCRFVMNPTAASISAAGGSLAVSMTTLAGCAWSATSDVPWLTITAGSGNASGNIGMSVASNSGASRVGHVTAAGQALTVTQSAAATPAPAPQPPAPTPAPAPPPQTVQKTGTASGLSGSCPSISFIVSSTRIATNSATSFPVGKCSDVKNGKAATVTGTVQADQSVLASIVSVAK